jgi:hypothetical protein
LSYRLRLCALLTTFALAACAEQDGATPNTMVTPDAAAEAAVDAPVVEAGPDTTPTTIETSAPARVRAGEELRVECTLRNRAGDVVTPTGMTPEVRFDPAASVRRDGMRTVASRVGTVTSRCALGSLVDATPASTEITVGAAARITTRVTPAAITAGGSAMVACAVTDAEGNPLADARPTVATMPTGEGVMVAGNTVSATRAGTYSVACQLAGATGDAAMLEVSPALPASLRIARVPDQAVYAVDDEVEIASVVQDRYGNRIAMPMLRHASEPMGGREVRPGRFQYNAEGRYTVTVQVTGPTEGGRALRETTSFVVDSNGPAITCTGDATMVDLAPGAALPVRGMLTDTSGVRSVRVGGQMVQAGTGGAFTGSVPARWGMNFVEVRAIDTLGQENVRTCTFLVSDTWQAEASHLTDGVSLQLTQAAMDDGDPVSPITSLDDILQTVLNSPGLSQQLHTSLRAANPLYDDCALRPCVLGVCTCLARARIEYVDRELNGPNVTGLTLVDGGLRARVRLENLGVRLRVEGTIDTDAWVRFRFVDVNLTFDVGAAGGMPRVSVRPGSVTVDVGTVSVQIVGSGFTATVLNAVVGVVTSLANGIIRDRVSSLVRDYVQTNFNAVLGGVVGGLNVSSLAPTFDVPRLDGSGTVSLGFGLNIATLNSTTARLLAGIGTRFTVARTTRATPSLGTAVPPRDATEPARSTPATVIVLPAVLNQALHALWRGGEFDARVMGGMGIGASLPMGTVITIATALPPVASLRSDGRVNLDLGALTLTGAIPGVISMPLQGTVGARASAAVTLVGNDLRFGDVRIDEMFLTLEATSMSAMENENLRTALRGILQNIVTSSLNDSLPAIPIPGFRIPDSLRTYGLPVGRELGITSPALTQQLGRFVLRGAFGVR